MVVLKMAKRWTEILDKFQKSINLDKSRKIWICGSIANRKAILVADDFKTSNWLVLDRIPVTSGTLE